MSSDFKSTFPSEPSSEADVPNKSTSNGSEEINHTYQDYSHYKGVSVKQSKKADAYFPSKLHKILSDTRYSDIITWMV